MRDQVSVAVGIILHFVLWTSLLVLSIYLAFHDAGDKQTTGFDRCATAFGIVASAGLVALTIIFGFVPTALALS
jgi:hypothetical protein